MQLARVNVAPAVAEIIGVNAGHMEAALVIPHENGYAVDAAFCQQIDGMAAELGAVEAIEQDGPTAAWVCPTLRVKIAAFADSFRRLLVK